MPVTVVNTYDYTIDAGTPVTVDVDFGALLAQAGWTTRVAGTDLSLRGFTLDVDSIRVVEYSAGFAGGPIDGSRTVPTASTFYTSPFHAAKHKEFDAQRNPAGTVMFALRADMKPQERRYYYVYASPLEYGKMQPAQYSLKDLAPLDGYMSSTTLATTVYGFIPQQSGTDQRLWITEPQSYTSPNRIQVETYSLGKFIPVVSSAFPNPLVCGGGQFCSLAAIVPVNQPFRVISDKPVVVSITGSQQNETAGIPQSPPVQEAFGFVPSWYNSSFAGRLFFVFGYFDHVEVLKTTTSGTVNVNSCGFSGTCGGGGPPGPPQGGPQACSETTAQLSPSQPIGRLNICAGQWNTLFASGGDIMVSLSDVPAKGTLPFQAFSVPSITGGPVGNDFFVSVPTDGGYVRICPVGTVSLRMVSVDRPSQGVLPEGPLDSTPPLTIDPTLGCTIYNATASTPPRLEIYSVTSSATPTPGTFTVAVGADTRGTLPVRGMVGSYLGSRGVDYWVQGDVGVLGAFNDTRVAVQVQVTKDNKRYLVNGSSFSVSEGGYQTVLPGRTAGATGLMHLVADKPIEVVSVANADWQYEHAYAGKPAELNVTVGAAEFRGPLVDLRSREKPDSRQDFKSTGPGTAITFPLEVLNLGHWMNGEGLTDTITVSCSGPDGWTVQGCGKDLTLDSGTAQRLDLGITPPSDALNVNGTFLVTARSSKSPDVVSTFKLIVFVEIRYGVGMWFDVEGGRKTIDPPIGVNPGETYKYNVVLKNTGSAKDTFDLTTEAARPGWSQKLLLEGAPVTSVTLDGGQSTVLTFAVTAPDAQTAQQNIVRIEAQSESNALAADGVNTATRIRPKIDIALTLDPQTRVAAPNETAVFNLTVNNSGNDIFRIVFAQDGLLPKGWNSSLGIQEIDLGPGEPYTFPLYVTPPLGAAAGDLATVKISAATDTGGGTAVPGDEVSAVVVVKKIHNVTIPALNDASADPGATLDYVLPLTNHGNGNDVVELVPGAVTPAWKLAAATDGLALEPGATDDLPLRVTVPNGTPPGAYNLTFTLRLTREAFQNLTVPVTVNAAALVSFEGIPPLLGLTPGRAKEIAVTARNVGNVPGLFEFNATMPPGWDAQFSPPRANLTPGAALPVTLLLNATRNATDGGYALDLTAALAGASAGATKADITVARPALYVASVDASGSTTPGQLVLVAATVGNRGNIAAENVSVELLVDGQAVDKVVLERITVNDTKIATLNWLSTHRTSDIKVVVDRAGDIVELSRDQHEATVTFGSKLGVPAPGVALLVAVLAGVSLLSARRAPAARSRVPASPAGPADDRKRGYRGPAGAAGMAPRSGQEGDR